ncbi:MAG: Pr6Pr family membrane protein, partial [Paludibacteraceae bacterium]|nr:Pr6Pr family membrane protein [Paludibacteraceae bacterium]
WRIGSLLCHVFLPILYVGDWFLFRERGNVKWYYPIAGAGFPMAYMAFILIQAAILKFDTSILIPGSSHWSVHHAFQFVRQQRQQGCAL